jgi:hypothetical protein
MKRNSLTASLFMQRTETHRVRPIGLGILAIVMTGQINCVASKLGTVRVTSAQAPGESIFLDPGAVEVTTLGPPAKSSYDPPRGQIESAADAAGSAAGAALAMTPSESPEGHLVASAFGFVAAPIAAVISGAHTSRSRLSQDKLAEVEAGLAQALSTMSQQNHLRDRILDAAKATGGRRFVPLAMPDDPAPPRENPELTATPLVGTTLETRVEELRLKRKGARDSSFTLWIKARVRMSRSSTGEVIRDETYEYQSGEDLFLDWALNNGTPLKKCTDYGYGRLAEQIVERILEATGEAPILVGAAAPKRSVHTPRLQVMPAAYRPAPALRPQVQFVSQPVAGPGTIYVYSPSPGDFSIQRPQTKDEAISEAYSDVNGPIGQIITHPNALVSLAGIAVAIPYSICEQAIAAIRGVSEARYRAADGKVTKATQSSRPAAALAQELVLTLGPRYPGSVVLLDKPRQDGEQLVSVGPETDKPVPVSWPGDRSTIPGAGDKVLKIEVLSAALQGNGSINPSLALHLEARATLLRGDDGREIYSCPVHYCGRAHKFTTWAAHDAKLFREELQRCYGELSSTVIDQLVARRLIAPGENPNLFLATQ